MADWNKNNPEKKKANDRNRHLRDKYGESMMEQFGVDLYENDKEKFKPLWAHNKKEEKKENKDSEK